MTIYSLNVLLSLFGTTWRAIPGPLSKRKRRLDSLEAAQGKKKQLELGVKQWTGSKLGKEYGKAVYCHPAYLTSM